MRPKQFQVVVSCKDNCCHQKMKFDCSIVKIVYCFVITFAILLWKCSDLMMLMQNSTSFSQIGIALYYTGIILPSYNSLAPGRCGSNPEKNHINSLRPRRTRRHFADDIFQCIFLNENEWISLKFSLKFVPKVRINNIPSLGQIMAWRRPGNKPFSEPRLDSLLTHICVARPQWVKDRYLEHFLWNCPGVKTSLMIS